MAQVANIRDANYWREAFLRFFEGKKCKRIKSAGLIPENDPTTLFTVAGMQQFKDDFLGTLKHGTTRAASVQKCLRTPDLEHVGRTQRHQTMFEMMGYFSFGDFFKKEAIEWIWEFYTSKEWCGIDINRLRVSVYKDDAEAYDLWKKYQPHLHERGWIYRLTAKDNFWPPSAPAEGPNGVCGPCSEIFYDGGEEYGPDDLEKNDKRFMELGNIVFTQFDRSGPIPGEGKLTPLPKKNIDFGGGFERLVMVVENRRTTLDTSLFMPIRILLRDLAQEVAGENPTSEYQAAAAGIRMMDVGGKKIPFRAGTAKISNTEDLVREKRIADHIRASVFCVAEGITPGPEGRGYVLRRLLRRAYRDGAKLGFPGPFLYKLVPAVKELYGAAYPEVAQHERMIADTIRREEEDFDRVLSRGLDRLEEEIAKLADSKKQMLDGAVVFDLHSTYGLPIDVTRDTLRERGLDVDEKGFEKAFDEFREKSRGGFSGDVFKQDWFGALKGKAKPTQFLGYEGTEGSAAIVGISTGGKLVDALKDEQDGVLVLDRTPFYGESGGQAGDTGYITAGNAHFLVTGTTRVEGYFLHTGRLLSGALKTGDKVKAEADPARRRAMRANHSATHLLHSALRKVLGDHVHQKGSLVEAGYLRFDFSHPQKVTAEQVDAIERHVNAWVRDNHPVQTDITTPDKARKAGALMFFGEKYGDEVRMLTMGDVSCELCGGTHVKATGDIGFFRVTEESSVASGVRRIEAVTGEAALRLMQQERHTLTDVSANLRAQPAQLSERVAALLKEVKELKSGKTKQAAATGDVPIETTVGHKTVVHFVAGAGMDQLLTMKDGLIDGNKAEAVVLAGDADGKANIVVGLSQPLVQKGLDAGTLVREIASVVDGKGGGKKHMAQAGGKSPENIPQALEKARAVLGAALKGL
ncbi:MAG: alanine--tRNA ligase [Planctomycetes bacterium]|nr:alanine--tRNA ligase [Planctomycetota bacterium]NUQ34399.1 alanine--tRNA ligase [Planctomycetaceae bacterium]